jgi:hypothetical protein
MALQHFGPRTGDQPVARPQPPHSTTQTQNKRKQTSIPLNWLLMQHRNVEKTALLLYRNHCAWSCPWQGLMHFPPPTLRSQAARACRPLNIASACYDNTRVLIDAALPCSSNWKMWVHLERRKKIIYPHLKWANRPLICKRGLENKFSVVFVYT